MDKNTLLRQYLDGELSVEEERKALLMIAEDPEMHAIFKLEQKLKTSFSGRGSADESVVPEGFTDQLMHKIEEQEAPSSESTVFKDLKNWAKSLWVPRTIQLRPVYGAAFALALLVGVAFSFYGSPERQQQRVMDTSQSVQQVAQRSGSDQVWVRFVYIDKEAESIEVAGDFNDWTPVPLTKKEVNGEQVWTGLVSMKRGEHRYMFVKDGEKWLTDPMAPVHREDGFGNKNAVIYL